MKHIKFTHPPAPHALDVEQKFYYRFADVVGHEEPSIVIESDDYYEFDNCCMGIYMFLGVTLSTDFDQAKCDSSDLGMRAAVPYEVKDIFEQFKITPPYAQDSSTNRTDTPKEDTFAWRKRQGKVGKLRTV